MAMTKAQAEKALLRRCQSLMAFVQMDVVTPTGNPDLQDPIADAILKLGGTVADLGNPTDGEITAVAGDFPAAFLDLAEYRLLGTIQGNQDAVDIQVGPRMERFSQINKAIKERMDALKYVLENMHGIGAGSLFSGAIDANFQTRGDDTPMPGLA